MTFDIDANGILNVSAKDRATGKTQAITITASSGLAKDEVEKMVKDAEAHAAEDKKRREVIDLRNQADNLAYSVEKLARREPRQGRSEAEAKAVEEAIAEARKAAEGEDAAAIKAAMDKLTKASHKLAEELYRQAGGPSAGPGAGAAPGARRRRRDRRRRRATSWTPSTRSRASQGSGAAREGGPTNERKRRK